MMTEQIVSNMPHKIAGPLLKNQLSHRPEMRAGLLSPRQITSVLNPADNRSFYFIFY